MSLSTLFLLALGLSMDAFAVSVSNTLCFTKLTRAQAAATSASFGVFQGLMPVIGFFAGRVFAERIAAVDHWVAFVLLGLIGGKMLWDAVKELREPEMCPVGRVFGYRLMLVQSLATSIDALAVGLSFALLQTPIWGPAALIGAVCALITACGVYLGKTLARLCALNGWAELLGGLTLLAVACNILREHHVFD